MQVARRAKGFEMNVLVYDIKPKPRMAEKIGFEYAELDELLSRADVLSLHLPLNKRTEHILGRREFSKMKDGAYLINTARGSLVDTDALVEALHSGKIAGAGLDVLEEETILDDEMQLLTEPSVHKDRLITALQDHILIEMSNVLITPHNAFNSTEAILRILDTTIENIDSFASGSPVNVIS